MNGGNSPVLFEADHALPLAHVTVALRRGALMDAPGKEGATRLLVRLLRRTAGGRTGEAVDERLDELGATLSGEVTRHYWALNGSAISRGLGPYWALLEETLRRRPLSEEEFERVRRDTVAEVLEELDDDSTLLRKFFSRRFFQGHPYSRPAQGTLASLRRLDLKDLEAVAIRIRDRQSLLVAATGDFDPAQAQERVDALAETLDVSPEAIPGTEDPRGPESRILQFVDKPARSQTQIMIGSLGSHPSDSDHTAFFMGHTIFGGSFAARLSQEIRVKRGWSYGAYSYLPFDRTRQAFSLWTFPKASDAADCIALQLDMLSQLRDRGVTARELTQAKKYLIRSHAFAIDTASKRVAQRLDQLLYDLPEDYFSGYLARIRALTLDEVNEALRSRLSVDKLLVTVVGTYDSIGQALTEAVSPTQAAEVVPYDRED